MTNMNMYQISSGCKKAIFRKEQEKREINDSNGPQLIHQCIVVDYLFTDSTFPYCPPKCCCKMRHLTKGALSFLYPVTWSSLQGSQSTVNSTTCLATQYHSFTSTCKYTFSPLACQSNMFHWSLSRLFHTLTSAKPITLHAITQRSKTDYPTTTHNRPFQVMCLKNITRPPTPKGSRIRLLFTESLPSLGTYVSQPSCELSKTGKRMIMSHSCHTCFSVGSQPYTTQTVPTQGTADLRWWFQGQEQVCRRWCPPSEPHKKRNFLRPSLPPSHPP